MRDNVLLLLSTHPLPLSVIERGDAYPQEVGPTVDRALESLALRNPSLLCYQSEVGPVRWLGPSTEQTLEGWRGGDATTFWSSRHLALDGFLRAPALNARPDFMHTLAEWVSEHRWSGERASPRLTSAARDVFTSRARGHARCSGHWELRIVTRT